MAKLTDARRRILESARGSAGVITMTGHTGLSAVSWKRNARWLFDARLIEPSPHGDWYITEAGRAALQSKEHHHER